MKNDLFKNFKSLKEKEKESQKSENNLSFKMNNVSGINEEIKVTKLIETEIINPIKTKSLVNGDKLETLVQKTQIKENSVNMYAKRLDYNVQKKSFTIFLKESSLEFIKDFVFYKVTKEKLFFYNQSDALVEGLDLIKKEYSNIEERPQYIKDQEKVKKGGRKRNSDEVYSVTTSCYIPVSYWDFVKDVTYFKVISGDMYFKDWDLIEIGLEAIRKKYKGKIHPRPDYIREDEMLRRGKKR
ncbi:hypothetical protein PG326_10495 [Riemerella anatipestifer]|nr:hypothetical protein [Riemerella anatipestifer]MDY3358745.1 hypothetical protein [Riemerella anatipestifer]